jgi:hypothetical protein
MNDPSEEFDCIECGQHIIRIIARPDMPKLCVHCLNLPGWFRYPDVLASLCPEGLDNLPDNEKDTTP